MSHMKGTINLEEQQKAELNKFNKQFPSFKGKRYVKHFDNMEESNNGAWLFCSDVEDICIDKQIVGEVFKKYSENRFKCSECNSSGCDDGEKHDLEMFKAMQKEIRLK